MRPEPLPQYSGFKMFDFIFEILLQGGKKKVKREQVKEEGNRLLKK